MNETKIKTVVEKLKELVRKGNVSRIVVRKGEREVLNIPVNVGLVGGVVAVASAKWVLLASILATVGFGCCIEVIEESGKVVNVLDEEDAQRVRCAAQNAVSTVKDAVSSAKDAVTSEAAHFEDVVDQTADASWTLPEEDSSAPAVHKEEHNETSEE